MVTVEIQTKKKKEVIDVTEEIVRHLPEFSGLCNIFLLHTSACITTADLDPGTDLDLLDAIEVIVPKLNYRHEHDPGHVGDHLMSSIIGPSLTVPFKNGVLLLGVWQRVVLIELNGPMSRKINLTFIT